VNWRDFLRGFGSVIDIFGISAPKTPRYDDPNDGPRRDCAALASDWRKVGDELRAGMRQQPGLLHVLIEPRTDRFTDNLYRQLYGTYQCYGSPFAMVEAITPGDDRQRWTVLVLALEALGRKPFSGNPVFDGVFRCLVDRAPLKAFEDAGVFDIFAGNAVVGHITVLKESRA